MEKYIFYFFLFARMCLIVGQTNVHAKFQENQTKMQLSFIFHNLGNGACVKQYNQWKDSLQFLDCLYIAPGFGKSKKGVC